MSWTGHMATDEEHQAPGRLELVRAFVNTLDVEEGTDRLADDRRGRRVGVGMGAPLARRLARPSAGSSPRCARRCGS